MKNNINIDNEINDFLLLDDKSLIENEYSCVLCKKLVYKVTVLQCRNGDWFCRSCAETVIVKKKECVVCNESIKSINELTRNKFIENAFNNKLVQCPYSFKNLFKELNSSGGSGGSGGCDKLTKDIDNGCKETVKIGELDQHLDECQYRFMQCLNGDTGSIITSPIVIGSGDDGIQSDGASLVKGISFIRKEKSGTGSSFGGGSSGGVCNKMYRFNRSQEHELECEYSLMKCSLCDINYSKSKIQHHFKLCQLTIAPCKLCHRKIKRVEMQTHQSNECQKVTIECTYKEYGCNSTFQRSELNSHLEKVNHSHYLLTVIQQYSKDLKECKEQLDLSNKRCNEILNKSNQPILNPIILKSLESSKSYKNLWTILNFSTKSEKNFICPDIRLPPFTFSFSTSEKLDYLRIYLKETNENIVNCEFSVCLLNYREPQNSIKKSLSWKFSEGKGFGWNKFIKISEIKENGFVSDDDKLTLEVSILIKPEELEPLVTV